MKPTEKEFSAAVNFLRNCVMYAFDDDLELITTVADEESQIDGYVSTFGEELPELLKMTPWMSICWNKAVTDEKVARNLMDAE